MKYEPATETECALNGFLNKIDTKFIEFIPTLRLFIEIKNVNKIFKLIL